MKRNAYDLGIEQRRPTWIVYARRDGKTIGAEDETRRSWASFLIKVRVSGALAHR